MLKVNTPVTESRRPDTNAAIIGQIQSSLQNVMQSNNKARIHEELLLAAGVRLDRAGAALLYKMRRHADAAFRVTTLAGMLEVDAPTVTRKVQQLERLGYVAREPDPDDGRASLIRLTASGQDTVDRILDAHRHRLARLLDGWKAEDVRTFATLLEKFSDSIRKEAEGNHDDGN